MDEDRLARGGGRVVQCDREALDQEFDIARIPWAHATRVGEAYVELVVVVGILIEDPRTTTKVRLRPEPPTLKALLSGFCEVVELLLANVDKLSTVRVIVTRTGEKGDAPDGDIVSHVLKDIL